MELPENHQLKVWFERNNQTVKQKITNILKEKKQSPNHWCQVLGEADYKKNIVEHEAPKQTRADWHTTMDGNQNYPR